jgi:hypothetical protein
MMNTEHGHAGLGALAFSFYFFLSLVLILLCDDLRRTLEKRHGTWWNVIDLLCSAQRVDVKTAVELRSKVYDAHFLRVQANAMSSSAKKRDAMNRILENAYSRDMKQNVPIRASIYKQIIIFSLLSVPDASQVEA